MSELSAEQLRQQAKEAVEQGDFDGAKALAENAQEKEELEKEEKQKK